jgi:peptidoglycan hydrolase CwlO-like protein
LTTEQELKDLQASIDTSKQPQTKPKSVIDELKETLLSLKEINPSLVDSSKIFEHLLTLVDAASIVESTNTKMDTLTKMITVLETENSRLLKAYDAMNSRFSSLEVEIKRRDDLDFNFKERSTKAVEAISQFLRTH